MSANEVQGDKTEARQKIADSLDQLKDAVDRHITEIEQAGENEHSADWLGRAFGYLELFMETPQLPWRPIKGFPGEYEVRWGFLEFSVSEDGHWDCLAVNGPPWRSVTLQCGKCTTIAKAKQKCQRLFQRQWKAMRKLSSDNDSIHRD